MKLKQLIAAGALVGILAVGGASIASAQDSGSTTTPTQDSTQSTTPPSQSTAPGQSHADDPNCPNMGAGTGIVHHSVSQRHIGLTTTESCSHRPRLCPGIAPGHSRVPGTYVSTCRFPTPVGARRSIRLAPTPVRCRRAGAWRS